MDAQLCGKIPLLHTTEVIRPYPDSYTGSPYCHVQWNISSLKQPTPNSSPLSEGNLLAELNLKHPWIPSDSNNETHVILNVIPKFLVRNVRTFKKKVTTFYLDSWWQFLHCLDNVSANHSDNIVDWSWFWSPFMTPMALLKKTTHSKIYAILSILHFHQKLNGTLPTDP